MSIINCPECGEKISTNSDHCVHCGCKLLICPECNTAYKTSVERCLNCGYEFSATQGNKVVKTSPKEQQNKDDAICDKGLKFSATMRKITSLGQMIFSIILAAVFVIFLIKIKKIADSDSVSQLEKMAEIKKFDTIAIVFICISAFLDAGLSTIIDIVTRLMWKSKIENGLDFADYYRRHKNDVVGQNVADEYVIAEEVWYAREHNKYFIVYGIRCFILLIDIIYAIVLGVLASDFAKTYMENSISSGTDLSKTSLWGVVIFAIVGVVVLTLSELVVNVVLSKYAKKAINEFDKVKS